MYCTVLYRCEMSLSVLLDPTWPQFSSRIPFRTEHLGTGLLHSKFLLPLLNVYLDSWHLSHSLHPPTLASRFTDPFPHWLNLKGCSLNHQPGLCSLCPSAAHSGSPTKPFLYFYLSCETVISWPGTSLGKILLRNTEYSLGFTYWTYNHTTYNVQMYNVWTYKYWTYNVWTYNVWTYNVWTYKYSTYNVWTYKNTECMYNVWTYNLLNV